MRLRMAPTINAAEVHPGLAAYVESMSGQCPFLRPSMNRNLTTWASYEATADDGPDLLVLLVEAAEDLRMRRRKLGPLVCSNIAIVGPHDIPSARAVLDWPHWITRNLYAPVQLMIGKFWIGEIEDDKLGRAIAPPPVSFFSIRHSLPPKDARFLTDMPIVSATLAAADDDGHDVLMPWLGKPLTAQAVRDSYDQLMTLFPPERKALR